MSTETSLSPNYNFPLQINIVYGQSNGTCEDLSCFNNGGKCSTIPLPGEDCSINATECLSKGAQIETMGLLRGNISRVTQSTYLKALKCPRQIPRRK